jgi:phage terminase large subunit
MGRQKKTTVIRTLDEFFSEEELAHYQVNPADFIYNIIFNKDSVFEGGTLYLSDQQVEVLGALGNFDIQNISVVSGKGVGKTALMAMSVIWFITCFSRPKIILTAPSFPQLKSALWPEVDKWLKQSLVKDLFEYTSEKLYYKDPDHKSNWFAEPRTAKEKENMQGLHADNMLLIVDEGSGVSDEIFDALDTTMTAEENIGVNKLLTMGNGTKTDGTFYESHHRFKKDWKTFEFSSLDSPFVNTAKSRKLIEKYGWEHDVVRVSVRGLFPLGNPDSLIPLNRVEDAIERDVPKGKEIHIGVDVARFGDDLTALTWREGLFVHEQITKGKTPVNETVDMVLALVKKIRKETGSTDTIFVKIDDTGLGGGVTDYLKLDHENNIEVIPVNFAVKSTDVLYQNTPSQIWGSILEKIDTIRLPDDDFLKAELSARTFKVPNGKIYIQPKAEFKKEFKESPDKADSLGLCLFDVKNQTVILPEFDRFDTDQVKQSIRYTDMMTKVVSIWYSKDMIVSIVLGAWDGFRLSVLEEFVGSEDMYNIAKFINIFGSNCEIIGNSNMFGDSSGDIKHQYRKMGVQLKKNRKYDEMGSVQGVVNFIRDRRVVIQSNCNNTISQMNDWNTKVSRKELEDKFGTCYATANLLSYVRENRQSSFSLPKPIEEYKKEESFGKRITNPISSW